MEGLRRAEGFLKRRLAQELNLRNTPELRFISDTSLEYGAKMSRMIEEVAGSMQDREEQENPDEEAF